VSLRCGGPTVCFLVRFTLQTDLRAVQSSPSQELIDLLGRLKLATPHEVRAARRHARRLAKDLTLFDSVWVDALVQARRLTAFQASEINAGRGELLQVGPYVVLAPLPSPAYAQWYRATDPARSCEVRLSVIPWQGDSARPLAALTEAIRRTDAIRSPHVVPIERCGAEPGRLWAASPEFDGRTAASWLVHAGRMPPDVVLEIARQMAAALAACEAAGIIHGDISTQTLVLDPLGRVQLLDPGLRSAGRPLEDDAAQELPAEAYDYLAPERARGAAPPSIAADIFACGAVWWHLLAGRPPLVGASGSTRRAAAQSTRIRDIYPIAPDTPQPLSSCIAQCTQHDLEKRPHTFATLSERLGPPSERGQAHIARYVARGASPPERLIRRVRTMRRSPHAPTWVAAAGGIALAVFVGLWPLWRGWLVAASPPEQPAPTTRAAVEPKPPAVAAAKPHRQSAVRPSAPRPEEATKSVPSDTRTADIALASATQPVPAREVTRAASREFVIAGGQPVAWNQIRPLPGQIVCARPGERAQIVIPPAGATLTVEHVRFIDVDFVAPRITGPAGAALAVTAKNVAFHRCSFQGIEPSNRPQAMIRWAPAAVSGGAGGSDATNALELRECVMATVDAGLHCAAAGDATVSLTEVLFLGSGPLARIDRTAARGGAAEVWLKHCTVRDAACVIELDAGESGNSTADASLRVEASGCVLAPRREGALIVLRTARAPAAALRAVTWRGEGSVVTPSTPTVSWLSGDGEPRTVADARLAIEGLVRTDLGFAGDAEDGPDASRLVRWQVPLRSTRPPGIGDGRLSLPGRQ